MYSPLESVQSGEERLMRKLLPVALALMLLAAPHATWTQATADASQKNAQQARAVLDAMVQAWAVRPGST
jgi:hypothetical protein